MASRIADLEVYVPEQVETNDQLRDVFPDEQVSRIEEKTGILSRTICPPEMTALDMAERAARKLLDRLPEGQRQIQYLILCTQSPDHFLPSGACILQQRLELDERLGAFDFNLGCSGYVYGLNLANALITSGQADRVLLVTADTYTRYINPQDYINRLLFGEAASATLVERTDKDSKAKIGPFLLRTDGRGAENLIVPAGAGRMPTSAETGVDAEDDKGAIRSLENLFMDGREIFLFTISAVRELIDEALEQTGDTIESVDWFVLHQANRFVLEQIATRCDIPYDKVVEHCANVGNTVSTSIPLALKVYMDDQRVRTGQHLLLVGFGVGYSWASCHVTL